MFWPLSKIVPWDALWPEGWTWGPVDFALSFLVQANLGLMLFNLLPLFPMDGGRVLRALLSLKMNPNRATLWTTRVGKVGAVGFVVAGLLAGSVWGGILIAIGITNFLACRREALAARYQVGPYGGERRESWQSDPDAWKLSGEAAARSRKRKAPKAPKAAPPDPDLDAEVDRVLDRVREVGMAGLSRRERKVLERAAARKRAPGR